jgi:hypothetical protein
MTGTQLPEVVPCEVPASVSTESSPELLLLLQITVAFRSFMPRWLLLAGNTMDDVGSVNAQQVDLVEVASELPTNGFKPAMAAMASQSR